MKKLITKRIVVDLLIIFVLSLTPLLWFKENSLMVGHDNVFPLDPKTFFIGRLFAWIGFNFGQNQSLIMGTIPIHLVDSLPSFLGFPLQITQKIVYVYWFFLMGLSAYILAWVINKESRVFKLTAAILYQFNFFILQGWFIGERTKFSAYIAMPLVLTVFLKVYRKELSILKGASIISLILFIFNAGGLFGISLYGGFFVALGAFIVFFSLLSLISKDRSAVKRIIFLALFSLLGFVLVNTYYILPAVSEFASRYTGDVQRSGGLSGFVDWASEISANSSYMNILRLQGISEWYDNPQHPYAKYFLTNPILILASFIFPILIFLSLVRIKEKEKLKIVVYFFIVFLLGIFFSAGTHPPFGFMYVFLLKFIPGFIAFRSPYFKFAPAIFLSVSFLVAFTLNSFNNNFRRILFVLFIVFILLYHYPYFIGNFFSWRAGYSTRNSVPDYVYEFGQWAEKNVKDERILLLPGTVPNWQYDAYQWGFLSLQSLPTLVTNKSVLSNDNKLNTEESQLLFDLYAAFNRRELEQVKEMILLLRIKYILVREDVSFDQKWTELSNPYQYENMLQNAYKFPEIKSFGKWKVYEVPFEILPQLFTTDSIDSLDAPIYTVLDYLSTKNATKFFTTDKDKNIVRKVDFSPIPFSKSILLPCINCFHQAPSVIEFPSRPILPDSPFYSLIILKEKLKKKNPDPKGSVYDDVGITLKRIAEIKGLVTNSKPLTADAVDRYTHTLRILKEDLSSISDLGDKIQTAEDIHFYLNEEVLELRNLFRSNIRTNEDIGDRISATFDALSSVNELIRPYIAMISDPSRKLYYFGTDKPGSYSLFLRNNGFDSFGSKFPLRISLDGEDTKTVDISSYDKWSSLGERTLLAKKHTLYVTLPNSPNVAGDLRQDTFHLDVSGDVPCYVSKIGNFDNKKTYSIYFGIPKELGNHLYTYLKRENKRGMKFGSLTKFSDSSDTHRTLISSGSDTINIYLGFCAENISKSTLVNYLQLSINEVTYPELLLIPSQRENPIPTFIDFQNINPTKYIVHINTKKPVVLYFAQRFDNAWKLDAFEDSHFRVLGYANGWIINKPGDYVLKLEYEPQKRFYEGLVITGVVFMLMIFYLVKRRKQYD